MSAVSQSPGELARSLYPVVFRTDFTQPGFALVQLGPHYGSERLRRLMVNLKCHFHDLEQRYRGRRLVFQSMGRFDQQVTTRLHRDGGPDESILMLGYEPTLIKCHVSIADYSKCARDSGISPAEFLHRFNPMFPDGNDRLAAYTTQLHDFHNTCFQILLINNSMHRFGSGKLLGVLHTAEIAAPDPDVMRVVNSTMIGCVSDEVTERMTAQDQAEFVTTTTIRNAIAT